jgi:hypothetical protein
MDTQPCQKRRLFDGRFPLASRFSFLLSHECHFDVPAIAVSIVADVGTREEIAREGNLISAPARSLFVCVIGYQFCVHSAFFENIYGPTSPPKPLSELAAVLRTTFSTVFSYPPRRQCVCVRVGGVSYCVALCPRMYQDLVKTV